MFQFSLWESSIRGYKAFNHKEEQEGEHFGEWVLWFHKLKEVLRGLTIVSKTGNGRDDLGDVNTIMAFLVGHYKLFIFIINKVGLHRKVLSREAS